MNSGNGRGLPGFSRRYLLLASGAVAAAAVGGGTAATAAEQNSAILRIKGRGVLTVAIFSEDVAPFFFTGADGTLTGVDPELARDIASKLGVKLEFNRAATTFDALVDEVVADRADMVISLLSDTLDRAERVTFSESYVSVRQFLLINRLKLGNLLKTSDSSTTSVTGLLDESKARIGVISGTSYVGFVKEDFPQAAAIEYDGWDQMLADVKSRKLTALMYDEIEIGNWRLSDPAGALELRPFYIEGHPDTIAIAMRHDDRDLVDWINLYLVKAKSSGFVKALLDKHLYLDERSLTHE